VPLVGDGRSGTFSALPSLYGGYQRAADTHNPPPPNESGLISQPPDATAPTSGLTFINSAQADNAGGATATLTVPSGVTTSDLGVLVVSTQNGSGGSGATLTGWTSRDQNSAGTNNTTASIYIFTRLGGVSAGNTLTVNLPGSTNATVSAAWYDSGGQDISSVSAPWNNGGVDVGTASFNAPGQTGTTDVIMALGHKTTGTINWQALSPAATIDFQGTSATYTDGALFAHSNAVSQTYSTTLASSVVSHNISTLQFAVGSGGPATQSSSVDGTGTGSAGISAVNIAIGSLAATGAGSAAYSTGSGGSAPAAISYVGESVTVVPGGATTTSITSSLPAGIQAGDFMLFEIALGLDPTALTTPSGWTLLSNTADPGTAPAEAGLAVYYKTATGSDTAPSSTATVAARWQSNVRVYRGVDTSNPFIDSGTATESGANTTTVHNAPTLTNTDAGAWGIFSFASRQVATPYTATPGSGLTERSDGDTGNAGTTNLIYETADSNGAVATGSVSYSTTGSSGSAIAVMFAALLRPGTVSTGGGSSPFVTVTGSLSGTGAGSGSIVVASTQSSAVAGTGAGSAAVSAFDTIPPTITATGSGAASVSGFDTIPAAISATGAGTAAVSGVKTIPPTVSATGAGSAAVSGFDTIRPAVSATGAGSAAVSGFDTIQPTIAATGTGSATAQAGGVSASVSATGAGSATVSGFDTVPPSVSGTGVGSASVSGFKTIPSSISATGLGSATVAGSKTILSSLVATASGSAVVTGLKTIRPSVSASGQGSASLTGLVDVRAVLIGSGSGTAFASASSVPPPTHTYATAVIADSSSVGAVAAAVGTAVLDATVAPSVASLLNAGAAASLVNADGTATLASGAAVATLQTTT
jgi:hypothetical protein